MANCSGKKKKKEISVVQKILKLKKKVLKKRRKIVCLLHRMKMLRRVLVGYNCASFVSNMWEQQNYAGKWKRKGMEPVKSVTWWFFSYQNEREVLYFDFFPSEMLWKSMVSYATLGWKWKPHLLMKHRCSGSSSALLQGVGPLGWVILAPVSPVSLLSQLELLRTCTAVSCPGKGLRSSLIYSPWIIQLLHVIALPHMFLP